MPVLDANFLVALRQGEPAAHALHKEMGDARLLVPDVVAAEFLTDASLEPERETVLAGLESSFTLTYGDPAWVLVAARLRAKVHKKGGKMRVPDLWIAAHALRHDTFVVTRNVKDFAAFGVKTRTW